MAETLLPPPNGLSLGNASASDPAAVAAADRAARYWVSQKPGPLRPGSAEHAAALDRMFRDTFNGYKPTIIDWPKLDPAARERLITLPIWDIAVQTEGKARLRMLSYARSLPPGPWHDAIEQNGWEEGRHKHVLSNLVEAYGITLEPEPEYIQPKDTEWAYLVTGFSECIDSFFAFGLFEVARRSGFFPPELVDTFEPVMQEECRHILLFSNWLAAHRRNIGWWRRPWFELRHTQRNVKRWQNGDMRKRWTAAGMLVAEQQFRRIIGYRDLAKLVIAIERHADRVKLAAATTVTHTQAPEAVTV